MIKLTLDYLAGYFDAHGWICCKIGKTSSGFSLHLEIGVNGPYNIVKALEKAYHMRYYCYRKADSIQNGVHQARLTSKKGILTFLELLSPYLIVKVPQAEAMIFYTKNSKSAKGLERTQEEYLKVKNLFNVLKEYNREKTTKTFEELT